MRIERRLGIRSAYGQLVLIVFLPIAILASVGAVLVFFETKRALQSEQDVLAQASLIRYEPIIRPLLPTLQKEDYLALEHTISEMTTNRMNALLEPKTTPNVGKQYATSELYRIGSEQQVRRVAILDKQGKLIMAVGHNKDSDWRAFDVNADSIWRLPTDAGTAYGMPLMTQIDGIPTRFWLFVDMDNEPITIAYYRILLALAITGLITILLLLLILSLYSKRWITPIYELRLFLSKLSPNTLNKTLNLKSDGEFSLLQKEINHALARLRSSFEELQRHSEQTEADLQQAFDEMEMQTISIRRANNLLKHTSDTKSAFLATISHELRTPLNAIDGFINLLVRSENLDSKQRLYVQTIKKSSAHLLALINDVLDFSKIEAGKLTLENQEFNLYHSILEVADMLSPTAFDKGLRMAVLFYHDVPTTIWGDKLRVKQILTNLIGNALKFTDTGDVVIKVVLESRNDKDFIKLLVIDAGHGVDKEKSQVLFQSFSQGDASVTRRYGGTGLGLMISKELTELMGGEIGFFDNQSENIATRGATFWFALPAPNDDNDDEPFGKTTQSVGRLLSWINHEQSQQSLKMALVGSSVSLSVADSLAKLLDELAQSQDDPYDWVIVDSHAQKGDLTALLGQVRRYYGGRLFVYGYQIGLSDESLSTHHANALYEPFDKEQFFYLLDHPDIIAHPPQNLPMWHGKTALIVDDHPANLLVLEALLQEFGIQAMFANSGFDAIDIMSDDFAKQRNIDLIFMDISMPVMSGIEACRAIRRLENSSHAGEKLPIIALTAHGIPDDTSEIDKAGLSDYATKPLAEQELLRLLQKWLSHQPTETPRLPAKDEADGLARAGGKTELADKLLALLIDSLPQEKTALTHAWQAQDLTALNDTAHRLLGATRYTGVPALRQALERFYAQSQTTAQSDFERLTEPFLAVEQEMERLMNEI